MRKEFVFEKGLNYDPVENLPRCVRCGGLIRNRDSEGCINNGKYVYHGSCWRETFGKDSALDLTKSKMDHDERMDSLRQIQKYINFDKREPGMFGSRKIA